MEQHQKEALTLENIKKDLADQLYDGISNVSDWRLSYIIPLVLLAIVLGIVLQSALVSIPFLLVALYHSVYYALGLKEYNTQKKALRYSLDSSDIHVTVERLSHIASETVYEPHGRHSLKNIALFHFDTGISWRPPIPRGKHYSWSRDHYVSTQGLMNISLAGDEFFYVYLRGHREVSYVYPCKFFVLSAELEKKA